MHEKLSNNKTDVVSFDKYEELKSRYPFDKYRKLGGTLILKTMGLPVLPGFVVNELNSESISFLADWAALTNSKRLSFRFDSPNPDDHVKLSSLNPTIKDLTDLMPLIKPPIIGIVMAENDRYGQWHSVLTQFLGDRMRLDIVGPGFDAGDITRGKISPHETIEFVHKTPDDDLDLTQLDIIDHKIVTPEDYAKSRMLRYEGIYATITNNLGISSAGEKLNREKMEKVNGFLTSRETSIPMNYLPIGWIQLLRLYTYLVKLDTFRQHYQDHFGVKVNEKVLSSSFLIKYGLVFWDLYDGEKYKAYKHSL